jgi:hypothetical protein
MGALLVFVGFVVEYAAWTVGLGGALLTRFGRHGALPDGYQRGSVTSTNAGAA